MNYRQWVGSVVIHAMEVWLVEQYMEDTEMFQLLKLDPRLTTTKEIAWDWLIVAPQTCRMISDYEKYRYWRALEFNGILPLFVAKQAELFLKTKTLMETTYGYGQ